MRNKIIKKREKTQPIDFTADDLAEHLKNKGHDQIYIDRITREHGIDGKALQLITESDLTNTIGIHKLGDSKRLMFDIIQLQKWNKNNYHRRKRRRRRGSSDSDDTASESSSESESSSSEVSEEDEDLIVGSGGGNLVSNSNNQQQQQQQEISTSSIGRRSSSHQASSKNLKPEFFKAVVSMAYLFVVTWITALTMVIVHDRVPDMEKYPPLPDLFLDNMPHIPWAFEMCEVTGTILLFLWFGVLFFHRHRFILVRRFFALSGTVFLLRCVTMLITSLSVPGTHLKCNPRPYGDWMSRLYNAYLIWKGAGMSIQGVRTCGDYMFSGHTVALTMLNFFITEYTPRRLYFIHTFSWLLNAFGIFFILAAHEHYSIDVFIAFYITSRLFLYYHTLANNQALMQRDSKRTKVWFPLFSYFESNVDGIVPNHYEFPITPRRTKRFLKNLTIILETKYKGKFFTRDGNSRGFGFFRTRVNAFIRPKNQ